MCSLHRYAVIGTIHSGHNFGVSVFAGIAKFTWQMLAVLFMWIGHWVFIHGIGSIEWKWACRTAALQIGRIFDLFFIHVGISLVKCDKLRFMVDISVSNLQYTCKSDTVFDK